MRILKAFGRWWFRFINYMITWKLHRDDVKHLNKLTDKELKEIDIKRYLLVKNNHGTRRTC